jgi:hypothetical protein
MRKQQKKLKIRMEDGSRREVVIAYREIIGLHTTTGEGERLPLLRDGEIMETVDMRIMKTMKECGWEMTSKHPDGKVVSPKMITRFLLAHMGTMPNQERLWIRILGENIPKGCIGNSTWNDINSPQGTITFRPWFWTRLFQDMQCHLSYNIIRESPILAAYSAIALNCGIDPRTRIFPFVFVTALIGKNYSELLRDRNFLFYMYDGKSPTEEQVNLLIANYNVLAHSVCNYPIPLEHAIVDLFCSSYFRGFPINKLAVIHGNLPMLEIVYTEEEKEAMMKLEEQDKILQQQQLEDQLRKNEEERRAMAPQPTTTQETVRQPSPAIVEPPLKPYNPYPTENGAWEMIVESMKGIGTRDGGTPFGKQREFLEWWGNKVSNAFASDPERSIVSRALSDYSRAVGFTATTDRWLIYQSAMIAILGGDDWQRLHEKLIHGVAVPKNGIPAKNALRTLGSVGMGGLIHSVDCGNITAFPMDVVDMSNNFLARIGTFLKVEDKEKFHLKVPLMMMIIYLIDENDTAWINIWKEFSWSYDVNVKTAVEAWKMDFKTLPIVVRAEILCSITKLLPSSM